jgi:catechol 2,3-dioxygenase-like lactoylglutathione lyase family enzyme
MQPLTVLRIARPTNDLDAIMHFYKEGLGLQELFRFENHDGFDGVMLGRPGEAYHFEFTRAHGRSAGRAPTEDNLVVFYLPDRAEWDGVVARMKGHGYAPVRSLNPYWDREGGHLRRLRRIPGCPAECRMANPTWWISEKDNF